MKLCRGAVLGVLLAVGLAPPTIATTVTASPPATAAEAVCSSGTTDLKSAVAQAQKALTAAVTALDAGNRTAAARQLRKVRRSTQEANAAAAAQIGLPPRDPESDDPPGPPAVLKASGLEHKIIMALVPMFSTPSGHAVQRPLARATTRAAVCRDSLLAQVIGLKPGKRDDYVDGLADTLPVYKKELTALAVELDGDLLTTGGRVALTRTRTVVTETQAAMEAAFGGGERPVGAPRR